jgi:cytosine/adenosine deaminase-related metal-dependent hydrolase
MTQRTLIRGKFIVTVDPMLGIISGGEVLIEDGVIAAVGKDLGASDAEIIDASTQIVAPGTVDTHRHTWQTQLRGCLCDISLQQYIFGLWATATPSYTPEDVYLGELVGALEALDGGVTTLTDYAHVTNSPAHADAGVDALTEAGIRAVYCYGLGQANVMGPPEWDRMADLRRLAGERFSAPGLVTLGAALSEIALAAVSVNLAQKRLADELGAVSTVHIGANHAMPTGVAQLHAAGVLDHRLLFAHANTLSEDDWKLAASAGVKVATTPESELNMGAGKLAINNVKNHGLRPTIGADCVSLNTGDLFTPTRQALAFTRWAEAEPLNRQGQDVQVLQTFTKDALEWATINGADALGLAGTTGSLTPGKQADIIIVGGKDHLSGHPVPDPVAQLIFYTTPGVIDTVMVAGKIVKRDGKLTGADLPKLLSRLEESAREIRQRVAERTAALVPPTAEQLAGFPGWLQHNLES